MEEIPELQIKLHSVTYKTGRSSPLHGSVIESPLPIISDVPPRSHMVDVEHSLLLQELNPLRKFP